MAPLGAGGRLMLGKVYPAIGPPTGATTTAPLSWDPLMVPIKT